MQDRRIWVLQTSRFVLAEVKLKHTGLNRGAGNKCRRGTCADGVLELGKVVSVAASAASTAAAASDRPSRGPDSNASQHRDRATGRPSWNSSWSPKYSG